VLRIPGESVVDSQSEIATREEKSCRVSPSASPPAYSLIQEATARLGSEAMAPIFPRFQALVVEFVWVQHYLTPPKKDDDASQVGHGFCRRFEVSSTIPDTNKRKVI